MHKNNNMTEELNSSDELTQEENEMEGVEDTQEEVSEAAKTQETQETESVEEVNETAEEAEEVENETETAEEAVEPTLPEKQSVKVRSPKVSNTEDFNWEDLEKEKSEYSPDEHRQLEDLYSNTFNAIVEQEVVMGTIVAKNAREIVVNIGFKSDGVLPANELRYLPDLKIGDQVDVYVESQEDASGQLLLSHKKARLLKSWEKVIQTCESGEIVTGYVKSKTKGGLIVDVFGIEAFLPGSQIDVKPIRDYDIFVDKTMEFKVVKINHEYKNVVVSHKALIESELEAQRLEIMSELEKGQVLEGVVKNITNYGAFVDLGGVDGLIHITDLSWGRVNDTRDVLELDQKINVVILDFDESKKRIALGMKQLTPHPWDALDPDLKVDDRVQGKVVVVADYGAFVEVLPGVEGLIHVSEMSWSQHLRMAQDFMKVGDDVEAVILTLDRDERKMSLGVKQLVPDPWITIAEKYPIGSRHTAIVRNFTIFGIFVELEEGVDGLIHISDLSWAKKIKHPAEFTRIGEKIDVLVLETDAENRRLSLGHKQLEENPWDVFETLYDVGTVHKGTMIAPHEKGAIINLQGVEGFAFNRGLQRENGTYIKVGESEEMKVIEFSRENKRIVVSHTKIWQDARDAERENYENQQENKKRSPKQVLVDDAEKSTLGDLEALVSLKADLELAEDKSKKKKADKQEVAIEEPQPATEEPTVVTEEPIVAVEESLFGFEEMPVMVKEEPQVAIEEPQVVVEETEIAMSESLFAVEEQQVAVEEQPIVVETAEVEKPKKTRAKKEVTEVATEEKPKKTRAKKVEIETVTVEIEAVTEEKPKRTRAKKVETESVTEEVATATEEKPKKTRAKKEVTEVATEEKPKKTRAKKTETKSAEEKPIEE